ncbi:hypothetical protein SteCoe_10076 [Stentor coeruleus]|uniref:Uncharacterized protein n=1 Tax=Stentor coeruleus TaxID=5963 RepID=A0A1R2CGE4_9CILI|nr:hypothetical protein SteCoe_10076 [Stentor coeruleus]
MNKIYLVIFLIIFLCYFTFSFSILEYITPRQIQISQTPKFPITTPNTTEIISNSFLPIKSSGKINLKETHYISLFYKSSSIIKNPTLKCSIPNHTFTPKELIKYFKYKGYKKCSADISNNIVIKNNTIEATCLNQKTPLIYIDNEDLSLLGGEIPKLEFKAMKSADLGNGEYVFIQCDDKEKYSFVINRLKDSVLKKIQEKSLLLSHGNSTKSLSVLLLIFDSVSRDSSKRNWPRTMNLLESRIDKEKFVVYDFDKAGAIGFDTRDNIIPVLFGHNKSYHNNYLQNAQLSSSMISQKHAEIQSYALWNYYSNLGYATLFIYDTVMDYLAKSTGRQISADYAFVNFWKAAKKTFGYSEFADSQRCIGENNAHYYSFNYTEQFFANYKGYNRFAYVHTLAAHEDSGNVETIDQDLPDFLNNLFNIHKDEDLVIYMMSDHGRGNPNLAFSQKGYFDHRHVMNYIILSKSLEKSYSLTENLQHNTHELLGRYDINFSLKSLAHLPYGGMNVQNKSQERKKYPIDVVDIFNEKIKTNRTCDDIGYTFNMCLCRDYEEIDINDQLDVEIANKIIEMSLEHIRENRNDREICKEPEVKSIDGVYKFSFKDEEDGWDTSFKANYKVQDMKEVNVSAIFTMRNRMNQLEIVPNRKFPFDYFMAKGIQVFMQIVDIQIDSECEEVYCVC